MERRLAAIMATDVVGYSRLIRADEEGTIAALKALRADLIDPKIAEHHGRIVKLMGDGMLVEFASVVDAVHAAVETQQAVTDHNSDMPANKRIELRIGINLGDVVIDGDDIQGDGVNVAARLEGMAEPGGICVSGMVYEGVRDRIDVAFEDLGEQEVKNIDRPVRVWRWLAGDGAAPAGPLGATELQPLPDKPSIAVLPFDNMSGDPEQEYFVDGITEDIITTLSKIPDLFVIARNSTFTYKGVATGVKQVAQDLGVRYVVEGSVRKAGQRVRITAQLIDASTGHHRWAERYDRDLSDIFALQDEITREIVTAVDVELTEGDQIRVWRDSAGDMAAYEYFAKGRAHFSRNTPKAISQAQQEFEKALSLNPQFAAAHAYVGWNHAVAGVWWSRDREEAFRAARAAAETALTLDNTQADAHGVLAFVDLYSGEHARAERIAEEAATLNPNSADIHNVLAMVRTFSGKPEEALAAARHACRLSPRVSYMLLELGRAFCHVERYEEALDPLNRVISDRPYWIAGRALLIVTSFGLGRVELAKQHAAELLRTSPRFSIGYWARTLPYKNPDDRECYLDALRNAGLLD
jgi:TolB-like protein/Flp pilus assembly protein TadD